MEKLGGLIKSMPRTAVLFLIGAIAIGGMPPFNGFISEFLIYSGLIEGIKLQGMTQLILMVLTFAGLSVIGGLSILTFTKSFGTIFLGNQRQPLQHKPHEVSTVMLIPQYIIIIVMLSVAVFPQIYLQVVGNILSSLSKNMLVPYPVQFTGYISIMQSISIYSLLFIGIIVLILGIRAITLRGRSLITGPTWGCGYTAPTSRIQYTGKSFSKSLSKMFNFLVIERKQYEELEAGEIFPKPKKYISHYHDFFEFRVIHVVTNRLVYGANYFKFIQNGRIQSYVLYGIIFILTIFILTIFNIVL
jgi:NADH:ubiquinone oxidoreductase subunit 5 (subunit L)/multisubunit Na+/H+ antiporter MnhA subunit